jgi:hypothetical protein
MFASFANVGDILSGISHAASLRQRRFAVAHHAPRDAVRASWAVYATGRRFLNDRIPLRRSVTPISEANANALGFPIRGYFVFGVRKGCVCIEKRFCIRFPGVFFCPEAF